MGYTVFYKRFSDALPVAVRCVQHRPVLPQVRAQQHLHLQETECRCSRVSTRKRKKDGVHTQDYQDCRRTCCSGGSQGPPDTWGSRFEFRSNRVQCVAQHAAVHAALPGTLRRTFAAGDRGISAGRCDRWGARRACTLGPAPAAMPRKKATASAGARLPTLLPSHSTVRRCPGKRRRHSAMPTARHVTRSA